MSMHELNMYVHKVLPQCSCNETGNVAVGRQRFFWSLILKSAWNKNLKYHSCVLVIINSGVQNKATYPFSPLLATRFTLITHFHDYWVLHCCQTLGGPDKCKDHRNPSAGTQLSFLHRRVELIFMVTTLKIFPMGNRRAICPKPETNSVNLLDRSYQLLLMTVKLFWDRIAPSRSWLNRLLRWKWAVIKM